MRACVLVLAAIVIAQPALARDQSHRSHQVARAHHHVAQARHAYRVRHHKVRRIARAAPIESGYAMPKSFAEMPQSFARTDASRYAVQRLGGASAGRRRQRGR